jgi:hypothetical protein
VERRTDVVFLRQVKFGVGVDRDEVQRPTAPRLGAVILCEFFEDRGKHLTWPAPTGDSSESFNTTVTCSVSTLRRNPPGLFGLAQQPPFQTSTDPQQHYLNRGRIETNLVVGIEELFLPTPRRVKSPEHLT